MVPPPQAIRRACEVPPDQRNEKHLDTIVEFVKDVSFFAELNDVQLRGLCRGMTLEVFEERAKVFDKGEVSDKFYIILSGGVRKEFPDRRSPCPRGLHANPEVCNCPNRGVETRYLEGGSGFGEFPSQSDQTRNTSIQTTAWTELLVTSRSDYDRFAGRHHRHFIEQRVNFLRHCPRIEEALRNQVVTPQDIAAMANCLSEVHLSGNALACKQGDVADRMVFVRSGQLMMLRAVDVEECGNSTVSGRRHPRPSVMAPRPASTNSRGSLGCGVGGVVSDDGVGASSKAAPPAPTQASSRPVGGGGPPCPPELDNTREDSRADPINAVAKGVGGAGSDDTHTSRTSLPHTPRNPQHECWQLPWQGGALASSSLQPRRRQRQRRLLRIDSVGPYQYYGDQHMVNGDVYHCSLVSDPVAEIYVMGKQDILRELSKKKLQDLFVEERQVPGDDQLVQMYWQTERWNAFRRGMHAEAISARSRATPWCLGMRQQPPSGRRAKAAENLEFLGIQNVKDLLHSVIPPPRHSGVTLTRREQEHFSDAPAHFLREVKKIRKEPKLREALARAGLARRSHLGDFLMDDEGLENDPMAFRFEEYWSKLVADPVGLDIDAALSTDDVWRMSSGGGAGSSSAQNTAAWSTATGSSGPPVRLPSVQRESSGKTGGKPSSSDEGSGPRSSRLMRMSTLS